jgi:hypothetical protein
MADGYFGAFPIPSGNLTSTNSKGRKPDELQVQQMDQIQLAINLKSARALGIPSRHRCWPAPTR